MKKNILSKKWSCIITPLISLFFYFNLSAQTSKPNIILILADDVGYEIPTCNGGQSYQTPNLDMMSEQGMRFTQCNATPLCSPSRFSLLTGKYNFRNYMEWGVMDINQKTIGNMFRDAGYKTACYGKWQLNGGDRAIHTLGFDQYCVWGPGSTDSDGQGEGGGGNRYKNPQIFTNGGWLPDNLTVNKYGEDIIADSVLAFINRNSSDPFFIYYPMVLSHAPESPTPDDPEFAAWDPANPADISFFPSMVKYMDKKIGEVINKIKSLEIENNTVIIYVGDNGTTYKIKSDFDKGKIKGGKGLSTQAGTHVPLLVYWSGKVSAGTINDDLVEFTDFFPTLADVAGIPMPVNNGTVDGLSFANRLLGGQGTPREWIFYHYNPKLTNESPFKRWVQTKNYKLYDTASSGSFYNITNDVLEGYPIADLSRTDAEDSIKVQLQILLDKYAVLASKTPLLSNPVMLGATDSSAIMGATVISNNNYALMERGIVYDTSAFVVLKDNLLAEGGTAVSPFNITRTGLLPQKKYFYKGYALNDNGFALSDEASFYTLSRCVIQQSAGFTAAPSFGSVSLQWGNAVFPHTGAVKAGYLLLYSTGVPAVVNNPNGKAPEDVIANGTMIASASSTLPALPANTASCNGLNGNTSYNFLLVPYTWNGVNAATYNYFTAGAKTTIATTLLPADPVINSITPASVNFIDGKFVLTVKGSNFYNRLSRINWNGIPLFTTYTSPTKLTASVASSYLNVSGSFNITVATNGAAGISNIKTITVNGSVFPLLLSDTLVLPSLGNVCVNTLAGPDSFTVSGSALNGSLVEIGPLEGYSFARSRDGLFKNSLMITGYGSSFSQTVYVNFKPQLSKSYNGNIPVSGGGAAAINILIAGSGVSTLPVVTTSGITAITQTSANVSGAITPGCDSIWEYGIEYSTVDGFSNGIRVASSNLQGGVFSITISNLSPNTKYYCKAYATTKKDAVYGSQKNFTTSSLVKPVADKALSVFQTKFKAIWLPVNGASEYRLDVSTDKTFAVLNVLNNKKANGTEWLVTGLTDDTKYYYRVRAVSSNSTSKNSNTIFVKTLKPFSGTITSQSNVTHTGWSDGSVTVRGRGGAATYTYSIDNGNTYFISGTFTNLAAGSYTIKIKDATNSTTEVHPVITEPKGVAMPGINTGINNLKSDSVLPPVKVFPNPAETEFTLIVAGNRSETIEIKVSDIYGKIIYQTHGPQNRDYRFGSNFLPGIYMVQVLQGKLIQNIKIVKSGR